MSLKKRAFQRENEWRDYSFSSSYLADFVLAELAARSMDEYSLGEIFSASAIEALLKYACKSINAHRAGLALNSFGSGGLIARPAEEGMKLEMLLRAWNERGWISISEIGTEQSFVAKVNEK